MSDTTPPFSIAAAWKVNNAGEKDRWLVLCNDKDAVKLVYSPTRQPSSLEGAFEVEDSSLMYLGHCLHHSYRARRLQVSERLGRVRWQPKGEGDQFIDINRDGKNIEISLHRTGLAFDVDRRVTIPEEHLPELADLLRKVIEDAKAEPS